MNINSIDIIQYYHAHIYYTKETLAEAKQLGAQAAAQFGLQVGHFHQRPVGPHPAWSCQLTVSKDLFGEVIPWLALNRGNCDFFVHPVTGNDLLDHTQHAIWLGKSYPLDLGIFAE